MNSASTLHQCPGDGILQPEDRSSPGLETRILCCVEQATQQILMKSISVGRIAGAQAFTAHKDTIHPAAGGPLVAGHFGHYLDFLPGLVLGAYFARGFS